MTGLITRIAWAIVSKMITERFLGTIVVEGLAALASKTENKFDDRVVTALRKALDVPTEETAEGKKS